MRYMRSLHQRLIESEYKSKTITIDKIRPLYMTQARVALRIKIVGTRTMEYKATEP